MINGGQDSESGIEKKLASEEDNGVPVPKAIYYGFYYGTHPVLHQCLIPFYMISAIRSWEYRDLEMSGLNAVCGVLCSGILYWRSSNPFGRDKRQI